MTELICIVCPRGCHLSAEQNETGDIDVRGAGCGRGVRYAKKELTGPVRMVTSTVAIDGAKIARLPVKSDGSVPKDRVMDTIRALRRVRVEAPVERGTVVARDVAGTGISFVSTRDLPAAAPLPHPKLSVPGDLSTDGRGRSSL